MIETSRSWSTAFCVVSWIFWSNITILFNKWIIETAQFKFPVILPTWHLIFATLATQVLARTTTLLDGRKNLKLTPGLLFRTLGPIAVLNSGSLICSNMVYLYLSVPFSQMLKATGPVITLLTSWLWAVSTPSKTALINILILTASIAFTTTGELHFSWPGLGFQLAALAFDANRLILIQILLADDDPARSMDPLVSLYYYAPMCAAINAVVVWFTEWEAFSWEAVLQTGVGVLVLNAAGGFILNVVVFLLIRQTSGLTTTLVSIPKNILLVFAAVLIWDTPVTTRQVIGYAVALAALLNYSVGLGTIAHRVGGGIRGWIGMGGKGGITDGRERKGDGEAV
ncbi:uncharacterized protein BDW47DRAFT_127923 [Aspergillus candidus]|uniref:Triose-phosphate transporter family-domain-containing protein n=1 Tax=Aspergillus candidus TaxID=41067 RepID=A0A2I2F4Y3_ASPCN|nr:triose-phosphate transporter family-domain-containing protein [Aspergillus candidus]PLB35701.1 triose-phosphate transporter family-domain-containing protein [Aspergillus candidus]